MGVVAELVGLHHQAGNRLRVGNGHAQVRERGGDEAAQLLRGDARLSHPPWPAPRRGARRRTAAASR
jgi:hypothetical protein